MDKKKKAVIIGVVVLVLVLGFIIIRSVSSSANKLSNGMEKLGRSFYEDYYYPSQKKQQKDIAKYMAKFEKNGIKINLDNVIKISSLDQDLIKKIKDLAKKEKCDFNNTKIDINPKKPYGNKDYTISVDLDCKKIKK